MTSYGYHVGCRMRFLLEYFGDRELSGPGQGCGRCDSCQTRGTPLSDQDQLVVRKALSAVARLDGRFGKRRLAEVLLGQRTEEVERAGLDRLSTFGLLADRTLPWLVDLLGALEAAGLVISSATEYPTLSLTPLGREVMHDRVRAQLALPAERAPRPRGGKAAPAPATAPLAPAPAPAPDPAAEARFERLRKLRLELARQAGQSPFIIFHDRTLRAIAAAFPRSKEELAQVPGVGPAKLEKYGDQVLAALRE
jgi:ATP-dependent DNA helicase RecQ